MRGSAAESLQSFAPRGSRIPSAGDLIGGFRIAAGISSAPIHRGTHLRPGVFDVTGNEVARRGYSLDAAASRIWAEHPNLVVAVRRVGQRGIESNHLHIADRRMNPGEAARLLGQRGVVASEGGSCASGLPGLSGQYREPST